METTAKLRPWLRIRELLATGESDDIVDYLNTLPSDESLRAVLRLSPEEQIQLVLALPTPFTFKSYSRR